MGMPVITTNFGGSLEFCKPNNSYLIQIGELVPTSMWQGEGNWAIASKSHLIELMKFCVEHKQDALRVGRNAYKYVRDNFNLTASALAVYQRLKVIARQLPKLQTTL